MGSRLGQASETVAAPAIVQVAAAAEPVGELLAIDLTAGSGQVAEGGRLVIPVTLEVSGGALMGAGAIEVRYDPAVLRAVACHADPDRVFDSALCNPAYDADGVAPDAVRLNFASLGGRGGSALLAEITFEALGVAGSQSTLAALPQALADAQGTALAATPHDGLVTVTAPRLAHAAFLPICF